MAKTIIGKVGMTPKGTWNNETNYERLDTVTYKGCSYVAVEANIGIEPIAESEVWQLLAEKGKTGDKGEKGKTGDKGDKGEKGDKPEKGVDYFTEEEKQDFKSVVVEGSKEEIKTIVVADTKTELNSHIEEKKTELDIYTSSKETSLKSELDKHTNTKKTELNTSKTELETEMSNTKDSLVQEIISAQNGFDTNAETKTTEFNTNAEEKLTEYNNNATKKMKEYNDNSTAKLEEYNTNATNKTNAFDGNCTEKLEEYNDNVESKTNAFNENCTEKTNSYNTNASNKTEEFNNNAESYNKRITELEDDVADLRKNSLLGTEEGEFITLNDCANARVESIEISGNSVQDGEPSIENPVDIKSCGYNINLFDGKFRQGNNAVLTISNRIYSIQDLLLKKGETYIFSTDLDTSIYKYGINLTTSTYPNDEAYVFDSGWRTEQYYSFTPTEDTYLGITIGRIDNNNFIPDVIEGTHFQLKKGTLLLSWSPYNQGNINIVKSNKNLFDGKFRQGNIEGSPSTNRLFSLQDLLLEKGKTYTLLTNLDISVYRYGINLAIRPFPLPHPSSNSVINDFGWQTTSSFTFTPEQNLYFGIPISKIDNTDLSLDDINGVYFQLEVNNLPTDYIPHEGQTFTIPVQQPMRSIRDVRDTFIKKDGKWYERHWIKNYVFNGSENWLCTKDVNNKTFQFHIPVITGNNFCTSMCNMFKFWKNNSWKDTACFISYNSHFYALIAFNENEFTENLTKDEALAKWKELISNTNLVVYYNVKEPIDLECTEEQSAILDNLEKTKTYKGITNIYSTDEISTINKVTYIKDLQSIIDDINNAITVLGGEANV